MINRETLTKSMDLTGQEETITATNFRRTPGDILLQTQMGKKFYITKNSVIIAVLSAPKLNAFELDTEVRRMRVVG